MAQRPAQDSSGELLRPRGQSLAVEFPEHRLREVISTILGHSGYAVTADVYAHVRPMLKQQAADAMHRALGA